MGAKTATVAGDRIYGSALPGGGLRLDTPAWFVWLDAATTTGFAYPLFDPACGYTVGVMTVRPEARQRGGRYWSVYRRQGPQLRKRYLGRSHVVTAQRLAAVAATLLQAQRTADHTNGQPGNADA